MVIIMSASKPQIQRCRS